MASPDSPFQRMIFDQENDEILFQVNSELEDILFMTYVPEGFIINTFEKGPRVLYLYESDNIIELPDIGYGTYFDILPGGNVLYSKVIGDSALQIFHYNPQSNETQLLIENILGVPIVTIRPVS